MLTIENGKFSWFKNSMGWPLAETLKDHLAWIVASRHFYNWNKNEGWHYQIKGIPAHRMLCAPHEKRTCKMINTSDDFYIQPGCRAHPLESKAIAST